MTAEYAYHAGDGSPLATKIRYEYQDGSKSFSWIGGNPEVLYQLPRIALAEVVHVGEGEKASDALNATLDSDKSLAGSHTATCSPTPAWSGVFSQALAGKQVILWVDRDESGEEQARKVAEELEAAGLHWRAVRSRTDARKDDAFDHLEAGHEPTDGEPFEIPGVTILAHPFGFVGERLALLRTRPDPISPLPGLLDPEPGLHVLVGKSSRGKTTLALYLAQCWATGTSPWRSAPRLPGQRSLVISREQNISRLDRRARQMDLCANNLQREAWTARVSLIARDSTLQEEERALLRMDEKGQAMLARVLSHGKTRNDPYTLVILDSLSRLKPSDVEENDNDGMTRWLDGLQEMAESYGAWLVLIHHEGKTNAGDTRTAARGASAIDAVAQGTWVLEQSESPMQRRLRVHGNALDEKTYELTVTDANDPGKILYWRLEDIGEGFPVHEHLEIGQVVTLRELARMLFGKDDGGKRERARQVSWAWQRTGVAVVLEPEGKGKPVRVQRTWGQESGSVEASEGGARGEELGGSRNEEVPF